VPLGVLGLGGEPLAVYLNDHLAGATAGVGIARRLAGGDGAALGELASEIEADRAALLDVMQRLDVDRDRLKTALGWGLQQASRVKLGGDRIGRLEQLEALALGVEGKLALWQALRGACGDDPRLETVGLDDLIDRARSQRRRLERLRRKAAEEAFART
jgi:hypothetical protein